MFRYNEFYKHLGNLFYAIATIDGHLNKHEKEAVIELVQFNWKFFEESTDKFNTDAANIILFQFEYNEGILRSAESAFESFRQFYHAYMKSFNHALREKIMHSARRIAEAARRLNKDEIHLLLELKGLFDENNPVPPFKTEAL